MNIRYKLFIYIALLTSVILIIFCGQATESTDRWHLVWEDNFNGSKLDTSKWNVLLREHSKHNDFNTDLSLIDVSYLNRDGKLADDFLK
jgi:hypothetical protein